MPDIEYPAPYSLNEGDSMVDLYNKVSTNQTSQRNKELDLVKGSVASLINSYNTTQSGPLREQIVKTMKSYVSYLPTPMVKEIEPYINNGPTSPQEEKRREYLKFNPPPREPELQTGDAKTVLPIYEQKWAEYAFQVSDHQRGLKSFLYGADAAGEKLTFFPISETRAALRSKEGQVMLLNSTDLDIKKLAEKYKVEPKDLFLSGGILPTGAKSTVNVNGRQIVSEEIVNVWDPDQKTRYGSRVIEQKAIPQSAYEVKHPESLVKLALDWKATSPKNPTIAALKERIKVDPKEIPFVAQELEGLYPGYTMRILSTKKMGSIEKFLRYGPFVSFADETALIPIKGKPIVLKDSAGKGFYYYYDSATDLVSNELGEPLGSYANVSAEVASKTIAVKK